MCTAGDRDGEHMSGNQPPGAVEGKRGAAGRQASRWSWRKLL